MKRKGKEETENIAKSAEEIDHKEIPENVEVDTDINLTIHSEAISPENPESTHENIEENKQDINE